MSSQNQSLAAEYGLNIVNVTWEDTGRFYNSAVGPNISDVTIQVQQPDPATGNSNLTLMPVIRYPNFEDLSADVSPDRFYLLVGNEQGQPLQRVSLTDYLQATSNGVVSAADMMAPKRNRPIGGRTSGSASRATPV